MLIVEIGLENTKKEIDFIFRQPNFILKWYKDLNNNYVIEFLESLGLTSHWIEVFYTPPQDPSLNPDPPQLCKFPHKIEIHYELLQPQAGLTNTITNVSHKPIANAFASETPITVSGTSGATYNVGVTQATSLTNATAAQHYNFTNKAFQSGSTNTGTVTIPASGFNVHNIILPRNTGGKKRFDITVTKVGETVLSSAVTNSNVAGNAKIIQEGIATLTVSTYYNTFNLLYLSLIHISEPTRLLSLSFCRVCL